MDNEVFMRDAMRHARFQKLVGRPKKAPTRPRERGESNFRTRDKVLTRYLCTNLNRTIKVFLAALFKFLMK